MAINMTELVQNAIGGDAIAKIGQVLGQDPGQTKSALGAAIPAVIGGVANKASSEEGLSELMSSLEQQDDGLLDNADGALSAGASGLMNSGQGILKMLFGNKLDGVLDLLSKTTGMEGGSAASLMGMVAPFVMSVLKRQATQGGLDAAGISGLLASQQGLLQSAMPSGMGDLMGGVSKLTGQASDAGQAVAGGVAGAADRIQGATNSAARAGGSSIGKLLPVIALLALALMAYQMFSKSSRPKSPDGTPAVVEETEFDEVDLEVELPEGMSDDQ